MTAEPRTSEAPALTENVMRRLWPGFKRQLESRFPGENWIRPLYLLRAIRASSSQVHLLAALPACGRLIDSALARLPTMREMLAPNFNISLVKYPDEWQLAEIRQRYQLDYAPKPWTRAKRSA